MAVDQTVTAKGTGFSSPRLRCFLAVQHAFSGLAYISVDMMQPAMGATVPSKNILASICLCVKVSATRVKQGQYSLGVPVMWAPRMASDRSKCSICEIIAADAV
jgi:hypothetical protein